MHDHRRNSHEGRPAHWKPVLLFVLRSGHGAGSQAERRPRKQRNDCNPVDDRQHREDRGGRDRQRQDLAKPWDRPVFENIPGAPAAIPEVLVKQRHRRRPRMVDHASGIREPDLPPRLTQPEIQLGVLVVTEGFVVPSDFAKGIDPHQRVMSVVDKPTLPQMATGTVVGGVYEIVGRLGLGGIGEVYEARHKTDGTRVAVKVVRRSTQSRIACTRP